jgi:hypothetical protein
LGPPKVMKNGFCSATTLPGSTGLPFVISTEAYPDFLLRADPQHHGSQQEIRGSAVERSAVQRSLLGNVFRQRGLKGVDLWTTAESAKSEAFFDAGSTLDQVLFLDLAAHPGTEGLGIQE